MGSARSEISGGHRNILDGILNGTDSAPLGEETAVLNAVN